MKEPRLLVVGDCTYVIGYVPSSLALKAGTRLARVLAGSLTSLASGEARYTDAVAALFRSDDLESTVTFLCDAFGPHTQITWGDGRSATLSKVFDAHFQGRMGDLVQWLAAAVEHNLASFFEGLPALLGNAGSAETSSTSPKT